MCRATIIRGVSGSECGQQNGPMSVSVHTIEKVVKEKRTRTDSEKYERRKQPLDRVLLRPLGRSLRAPPTVTSSRPSRGTTARTKERMIFWTTKGLAGN